MSDTTADGGGQPAPLSEAQLAADILRQWFLSNEPIDADRLREAIVVAINALAERERASEKEGETMATDENNMAEAAARADARGAARDYAGVLAQQRRLPRHCQWCAWRPDERVYYMREPLKRCLACGLWLCAACDYAHNCANGPQRRSRLGARARRSDADEHLDEGRKVYLVFYHPQPYQHVAALYSVAEVIQTTEFRFNDDWSMVARRYEALRIPVQGIAFFAPVEDVFGELSDFVVD